MTWVLILWLAMDRGGGITAVEFTSQERCEAAAMAVFNSDRFRNAPHLNKASGNYVCVTK